MSELSEEQMTEKFQTFVGTKTGKSIYRVKGKKIVAYAKAIGVTDLKYKGLYHLKYTNQYIDYITLERMSEEIVHGESPKLLMLLYRLNGVKQIPNTIKEYILGYDNLDELYINSLIRDLPKKLLIKLG